MAIFEAEHQNRTTSEDLLTSRIFGALSVMDKRNVLIPFLRHLIKVSQDDQLKNNIDNTLNDLSAKKTSKLDELRFILWEHFGYRCPDVYIHIPKYLIVIEVKEHTKATSDQIVEQYNSVKGEAGKNEVAYFLLTNDEEDSQAIADAKTKLKHYATKIEWVKWKQVWKWLKDILKEKEIADTTDERLLNDLIQLLEDKEMMYATGIKPAWFTKDVATSIEKINDLYRELRLIVLDFRLKLDELELKKPEKDLLDFEKPNPKKPSDEQVLVSPWIQIRYRDKKWRKTSLKNAYLFILADLTLQEPDFSVGFYTPDKSDEECDDLEASAREKVLDHWRDPPKRGKRGIGICKYLLNGSSNNKNSVTMTQLEESLKEMRDFVREYYKIGEKPRISNKSKRRR